MSIAAKLGGAAAGIMVLLLGLAAGGLIAVAPDIALPAAVLLAPGLIAFTFDPTPRRAVARAMLLFQTAAGFQPLSDAWSRCEGIESCMDTLVQPRTVLTVWLMAAVAWVLTQTLPIALKLLSDYRVRARRAALEVRRDRLIEDWGLDGGP
nr:hypothetical protein [uncultured Rhodopila sp.]